LRKLNNNYLLKQQWLNDNAPENNDYNNDPEVVAWQHQENVRRISKTVNTELLLYACGPNIPLQDEQQRFTCPLNWWKLKQNKYKLLSEVALCLLCIPATTTNSRITMY
jgi:hypothetical protein